MAQAGGSIRKRWRCWGLALATVASGLAWRLAPLPLPFVLYKYGGSALWAGMIYWLTAGARSSWRVERVAGAAIAIAAAVEFFKLVETPTLTAFRITLAGKLLLGRFFSLADLAVYVAAIAAAAWLDWQARARGILSDAAA